MVYYTKRAEDDFYNIIEGLVKWRKHPLAYNHAIRYVLDLRTFCDKLDAATIHLKTVYEDHKKHGQYVFLYKRNAKTQWNIIYNKDHKDDIYIEKIISNYITAE